MDGARVAGCDLGKATAKLVVARVGPGGEWAVETSDVVAHDGRPLDALREWYAARRLDACAALGATGLFGDELVAPAMGGLPEDACLRAALDQRSDLIGPLNLIAIGARGYAALSRDARGAVRFVESDKCSSGTGENMVRLASRFGLAVDEADRAAAAAAVAIPITARCSVFAKSELTHFANQGKPADQLLRGYFESVARHVAALLARIRVDGPIYAIGGSSRLATVVAGLRAACEAEVLVPEGALLFEALGAARLAAEQWRSGSACPLPASIDALVRARASRIGALAPASRSAHRVTRLEGRPVPAGAAERPTVLGLDLGSTGSKAALSSIDTGEVVLDVYDRTRGNPVEAARRLIESILDRLEGRESRRATRTPTERARPDVRAIGVTGSGREAVATVLRATYPEHESRIVVMNEIIAHATAAIRCDDRGGESLSIVEIGGQDAKFIQIAAGQIVESDLNKACSAGTGSFLEEQAAFYGVHDIAEFTRLAREAERPPDLGQMCTVFVAEAAAEAHRQGYSLADVFGGFQYSVIHNYVNRVVGQRALGARVFFQGKPAAGESLAWTLAAVTGREVVVPPRPGEMGAWGIALAAARELGRDRLLGAPPFDLAAQGSASIVRRTEFQCRDKRCATLCRIDRTTVSVAGKEHTVLTGGACPKFEVAAVGRAKLPIEAPSAFDEREALVARFAAPVPGARTVAIPCAGAIHGVLPFLVTFLHELGLGVRVLRSSGATLARGEDRSASYDACAPVKVAHGLVDDDVEVLFFPKVLDVPDREGPGGKTCPMEQAMPDLVEHALRGLGRGVKVVRPVLPLQAGLTGLLVLGHLAGAAVELGCGVAPVHRAVQRAAVAQARYLEELAAIGRRTLTYAREHGIPVVAVCGTLHTIHDPAVNAQIPALLRDNGALALPMDAYPIPEATHAMPRLLWADSSRALRVAASARERGDAFPLWLSSFGCGPASFNEHIFSSLTDGYPHTVLESDGHGGAAGFVTRIQAFLHAVRQHEGGGSPVPRERLRMLEPLPEPPMAEERGSKLVAFALSDRFSSMLAATYRSFGYDAIAAPASSPETLELGRRDCSGKECIPYQLMWGSFRKHLESAPAAERTVLLQVQGDGACRNCAFSIKDQISLAHLGRSDRVAVRHARSDPSVHTTFGPRFFAATVAWGILHQLATYHRPVERSTGEIDAHHARLCDELERVTAEPAGEGAGPWLGHVGQLRRIGTILDRAAEVFAEIGLRAAGRDELRTVLLSGNVYVRLDEVSNDALVRRLAERSLRAIVEPVSLLAEYFAMEGSSDLVGLPTGLLENAAYRAGMAALRARLYARVRASHPWLPMPDPAAMIGASRAIIGRHPRGEAPVTIASVLHAWQSGACDGVVLASPWGCGPALVSESVLRREPDMPLLVLYSDGSPLDERRLNSFAFQLRRSPPRTPALGRERRLRPTPTGRGRRAEE